MGSGVVGVGGRRCGYCCCRRNEVERKRGEDRKTGMVAVVEDGMLMVVS